MMEDGDDYHMMGRDDDYQMTGRDDDEEGEDYERIWGSQRAPPPLKPMTFTLTNNRDKDDDDDSFEDDDGKPKHKILKCYVEYHLGEMVQNRYGGMQWKATNRLDVVADFYVENPSFIEEKRAKYRAYNKRMYNRGHVGDIIAKNEGKEQFYKDHIGFYLEREMTRYPMRHAEKVAREKEMALQREELARVSRGDSIIGCNDADTLQRAIVHKKLRIDQVRSEQDIVRYLCYHTKHQERGIRIIARKLYSLKYTHLIPGRTTTVIHSILASGVSGCGKTELIKLILPLFYMEPGGVNERCFIQLHFATYSDSSHRNAISGPGAGYKGSSQPCLVDNLIDALDFIKEREINQNNQYGSSDERLKDPKRTPPKIIILFIDEICKPDPEVGVLNSLNSLLSNGYLKRASGNKAFKLPYDVTLLVYSTANFGSDAMIRAQLTPKDIDRAKRLILYDMRARGNQECDISRMGEIIPFFPLTEAQAREVMLFYVDQFFLLNKNFITVGQCYFDMPQTARENMATYFLKGNYVPSQGVKNLASLVNNEMEKITFNLNESVINSMGILDDTPALMKKKLENGALSVDFKIIPFVARHMQSVEQLCQRFHMFKDTIDSNETNLENMKTCLEAHSDIGFTYVPHFENKYAFNFYAPQTYENDGDEAEQEDEDFAMVNRNGSLSLAYIDNNKKKEREFHARIAAHIEREETFWKLINESSQVIVDGKTFVQLPLNVLHDLLSSKKDVPPSSLIVVNNEDDEEVVNANDITMQISEEVVSSDESLSVHQTNNHHTEEEEEEEDNEMDVVSKKKEKKRKCEILDSSKKEKEHTKKRKKNTKHILSSSGNSVEIGDEITTLPDFEKTLTQLLSMKTSLEIAKESDERISELLRSLYDSCDRMGLIMFKKQYACNIGNSKAPKRKIFMWLRNQF